MIIIPNFVRRFNKHKRNMWFPSTYLLNTRTTLWWVYHISTRTKKFYAKWYSSESWKIHLKGKSSKIICLCTWHAFCCQWW